MNAIASNRSIHSLFPAPHVPEPLNSPLENALLATLSAPLRQRLFPKLELCGLPHGTVLSRPALPASYCYFPIDCLISRHEAMGEDAGTALAVVGNDGVVGADLLIGQSGTATVSVVQIAGHAFRVDSNVLMDELSRDGELLSLLCRYSEELQLQTAQTIACNRDHTPEQHLSRWLLLALDRIPNASFRMTQQQVSQALGVMRPRITQAAWRLQKEGVLHYSRGVVTLLDRGKLAARAQQTSSAL